MRIGLLVIGALLVNCGQNKSVVIGSKAFTEGYLLGELAAQTLEQQPGTMVTRRFGLGGTGILVQALLSGEIDVYAEYTGTISEVLLKKSQMKSFDEIQNALGKLRLRMGPPLGFDNTYALAVTRAFAKEHQLKNMSDLLPFVGNLRAGFSHEFMNRADGFRALAKHYSFRFNPSIQSMEHTLAYQAIGDGGVDLIDVYSTDAKIEKLDLVVLEDDLKFFPSYQAVLLVRQDFIDQFPELWARLNNLGDKLDASTMRRLNAQVDIDRKDPGSVVARFLGFASTEPSDSIAERVLRRTKEHLFLVSIALAFSIVVGIPLGILASRYRMLGQGILLLSGLIQTIPSLALLCFLIPFFGIGRTPALIALSLYGLLPVVLNTFTGLRSIDPGLKEMARALGLRPLKRLWKIELPLASRSIFSGVRASAIIGIGTATLAALIGAGGYGVPIVTGLATNNMNTILIGAIPAAVLALVVNMLFNGLEHWLLPRGLRK